MNQTQTGTPKQLDDPEIWVDQYGESLYRFALARVKDPSIAEDLVQETFLSAFKAYKKGNFVIENRRRLCYWFCWGDNRI